MKGVHQDLAIPLAVKAIAPSSIHIVQFVPISRANASSLSSLQIESEAIYDLLPSVPGVGK